MMITTTPERKSTAHTYRHMKPTLTPLTDLWHAFTTFDITRQKTFCRFDFFYGHSGNKIGDGIILREVLCTTREHPRTAYLSRSSRGDTATSPVRVLQTHRKTSRPREVNRDCATFQTRRCGGTFALQGGTRGDQTHPVYRHAACTTVDLNHRKI